MLAPVAACGVCAAPTPYDWERCGSCGAQRLLDAGGAYAGHRRLAALRRRVLAVLVDVVGLGVPLVLALLVPRRFAEPGRDSSESLLVVLGLAAAIYPTVALGAHGRTIGKRLLRIHVVTADGSPVGYPRAGVREGFGKVLLVALAIGGGVAVAAVARDHPGRLGLWFLALVPIGLALAAVVMAAFDERRQAVHDKAARTVVVAGPPAVRVSRTAAQAPPAAAPPAAPGAPDPAG